MSDKNQTEQQDEPQVYRLEEIPTLPDWIDIPQWAQGTPVQQHLSSFIIPAAIAAGKKAVWIRSASDVKNYLGPIALTQEPFFMQARLTGDRTVGDLVPLSDIDWDIFPKDNPDQLFVDCFELRFAREEQNGMYAYEIRFNEQVDLAIFDDPKAFDDRPFSSFTVWYAQGSAWIHNPPTPAGEEDDKPHKGRKKRTLAPLRIPPMFKSASSSQPIRAAFSHAAEGRGTEKTESGSTLIYLAPINAKGDSEVLSYQYPLIPEMAGVDPRQYIQSKLGLKAYRYSLGIECLYYAQGNHAEGYLDLVPEYLLSVLGMTDRTENRRQIYETLVAMSSLRVFHHFTEYRFIKRKKDEKGKMERTTEYGSEPYIRLHPFSTKRELSPKEAFDAIVKQRYDCFDGVRIYFAHPKEYDKHFYYLPSKALTLGAGKTDSQQQLMALAVGDFVIRSMVTDWTKYGGIFKAPLFPSYKHGHTGDITHATRQGLFHQAGLSTKRPERLRESAADIFEIARKRDLVGLVEFDADEPNNVTCTAPLWLWDLMQESKRKYPVSETKPQPCYVEQLRKGRKLREPAGQ